MGWIIPILDRLSWGCPVIFWVAMNRPALVEGRFRVGCGYESVPGRFQVIKHSSFGLCTKNVFYSDFSCKFVQNVLQEVSWGDCPSFLLSMTKLKPRWNLHLWGDEDWLRRHCEALPPVLGGRSGAADWLPRYAYFTLVLV